MLPAPWIQGTQPSFRARGPAGPSIAGTVSVGIRGDFQRQSRKALLCPTLSASP